MVDALFESAGDDRWTATDLSRGPWDERHCHGGPVGALLTRAIEGFDDDAGWHLARLSIELMRPVPVGRPLSLLTALERPGRRVSLVAAHLALDDGTEVARVRALRIRRGDDPLPVGTVQVGDPAPGHPETSITTAPDWRADWRPTSETVDPDTSASARDRPRPVTRSRRRFPAAAPWRA
jgi:hypothetical protein